MKRHEWWYIKRLQKYFNEQYYAYIDTAEWFGNPEKNKWRCIIRELGIELTLICDDKGNVTEERRPL